jgi:hypothetical protein
LTGRAAAALVFPSLSKVPTIGGVVLDDAFAPKNEPAPGTASPRICSNKMLIFA